MTNLKKCIGKGKIGAGSLYGTESKRFKRQCEKCGKMFRPNSKFGRMCEGCKKQLGSKR